MVSDKAVAEETCDVRRGWRWRIVKLVKSSHKTVMITEMIAGEALSNGCPGCRAIAVQILMESLSSCAWNTQTVSALHLGGCLDPLIDMP